MPGCYVISKRNDGWVITADGSMLLVCERKKDALRAVREAMARDGTAARGVCPSLHAESQIEIDDENDRPIAATG